MISKAYAAQIAQVNMMPNTVMKSGMSPATSSTPTQSGSLSMNVNVAGSGSLQQIVQATTYNTLYDIFTLPGGQTVYKLRGL